jgi:ubiquinone/menaquinone biosynthesis C-methylase UbiE
MSVDDSTLQDTAAAGSVPSAGWQLAGTSQEAYERHLVPAIFAPCAELLLDLAAPAPGERLLDVACGTGVVARLAAQRVGPQGRVAGADVNEGMLAVARTAAAGLAPAIEWEPGDATALPFPGEAFDVVCCQQGIQFFGDQSAALREMHRVLAPGGRVAVAAWRPQEHSPGFTLLTELQQRHVSAEAAAILRGPFAAPDRSELRRLLTDAGFADVSIGIAIVTVRFPSAADFVRLQAASSPLGPHVDALDDQQLSALLDDARASFESHSDDDGIAFALQTWLIRGTRT